jgi:hypothetical protein
MRRFLFVLMALAACGDNVDSQLVRVTDEQPGAHCATGGSAVAVGVDRDADGLLDDNEVESVEYVCNGPAQQVLVVTSPEPVGTNCAHGGVAIDTGLDVDIDGVLDAGEVQHRVYVCNGEDAIDSLVVTRAEPSGVNCTLGGMAIVVGRDVDRDGTLDPDEITSTSFVCNAQVADTLDGGITINNELDIQLLQGVKHITGGLGSFFALPDIELPDLETVGGIFWQAGGVVKLPALRSIANTASINCRVAELTSLETVGGDIFIGPGWPTEMTSLDLPALRSVGGEWFVIRGKLAHLGMPNLEQAPKLFIEFPELVELDLASLQVVATLNLIAPKLPSVELPALRSAGPLFLETNAQTLALPALEVVTGFGFRSQRLTSASFPVLSQVGGLGVDRVPVLTTLEMPAVTSIAGPVTVIAPQLPVCQIDAILAQASYTGPRTIQAAPCP